WPGSTARPATRCSCGARPAATTVRRWSTGSRTSGAGACGRASSSAIASASRSRPHEQARALHPRRHRPGAAGRRLPDVRPGAGAGQRDGRLRLGNELQRPRPLHKGALMIRALRVTVALLAAALGGSLWRAERADGRATAAEAAAADARAQLTATRAAMVRDAIADTEAATARRAVEGQVA